MIGFIVDEINNNSNNYIMFRELNKLAKSHDCYLFATKVNTLPINNDFAILQQLEAMHHKGILVSTSIITTQILANNLTASKKYFYPLETEWVKMNGLLASQLNSIFYNDEIDLIARSKEYERLLSKLFKPTLGTVYNWNYDQLKEVLEV